MSAKRPSDVDCDERRDVGNCEAVPRNKLVSVQLAIHPFEALINEEYAALRRSPGTA